MTPEGSVTEKGNSRNVCEEKKRKKKFLECFPPANCNSIFLKISDKYYFIKTKQMGRRKKVLKFASLSLGINLLNTFLLTVTVRLRITFHLLGGELLISKAATGVGECSELRVAGDGKSLQPGCVYKTLRNANATLTENQNSNKKRQKYLHIAKLKSCKTQSKELFSYIIHSVLNKEMAT